MIGVVFVAAGLALPLVAQGMLVQAAGLAFALALLDRPPPRGSSPTPSA
ncbi:hypothetical protein [Streptomyces tailanensis]|nr:hypothetical protein [Streptomyces tailanensis]